jgi:serine/threonine-protein kinase
MSAPDRSDRVRELFGQVVGLGPEERTERLASACGNDEELRREVESLLEAADAEGWGAKRALENLRPERGREEYGQSGPAEISETLRAALADRYSIVREIGRGGMATVYLAEDRKLPRQVAIKVLNPDLSEVLGADRFLREIETASSLTHPHILPLYDSGEAEDLLYYVMPYVEGESLRDRLKREKQLPVEDAVRIAREVADALAYAHDRGVVHRDVKPANILLEADHAVLADFGVAKAVAEVDRTHLTQTGTSLGTPTYMSPEQASGEQALDGRSDQYALGCVLYEMLVGDPPFRGARVEAVVRQHLSVEPSPVTQARPSVPEGVAAALHRALAKNPADRFQSTRELRAALDEGLHTGLVHGSSMKKGALLILSVVIILAGAWALVEATALLDREPGAMQTEGQPESGEVADIAGILNKLPGIAVLPFANRSGVPDDQYFTDGIHDELLTRLQRTAGLRVIARTSMDTYRGTEKPIREIGRELQVGYVLEGGVQRAGDRVRINLQLVDARDEDHLWADTYDRVITPENLLDIQTEVVRAIAGELSLTLREEELVRAARRGTEDAEAYDLFIRGLDAWTRSTLYAEGSTPEALGLFEEAIELDPGFVQAHAFASRANARLYGTAGERTVRRREAARSHVEHAVEIDPESDDARLAMGYYHYRVEKDYGEALRWLGRVSGTLRGDFEYHRYRGYAERRMGRWAASLASLDAALALSPRSSNIWREIGLTFQHLRRYADAEAAYQRAIELNPASPIARWHLAHLTLQRSGATNAWSAYVEQFGDGPPRGEDSQNLAETEWILTMHLRDYHRALLILGRMSGPLSGQLRWYPEALMTAWAFEALGEHVRAREAYREAASVLEERVQQAPSDERYRSSLGLAYAGLGRPDAAVREAVEATELLSVERDALAGPVSLLPLAGVHARIGNTGEALVILEQLLTMPSRYSAGNLRHHYLLAPLHDDPTFIGLLEREPGRVF